MGRQKRSEKEAEALFEFKEIFIERFKERQYTLNLNNKDIADKFLKSYKERYDKNCEKKFINHINKWISNSDDNTSLPQPHHLSILADILDCDTDYLLGNQALPRKNIQTFADGTGLQYESIENLYCSLKEAFGDMQSNTRLRDMLNFILIKQPDIPISIVETIYKAFINNDLHKESRYTLCEYESIENRKGLVHGLNDYPRVQYFQTMDTLDDSIKSSGIISKLLETCIEYWIYRHNNKYEHYVYDPYISDSENKEQMKHAENNNRITKESISEFFSKTHK